MNCHALLYLHSNDYKSNYTRIIQKGGVAYLHKQPLRRNILSLRYVFECGGNKQFTHAQKEQPIVLLRGAVFGDGGKIVNIGLKKGKCVVLVA